MNMKTLDMEPLPVKIVKSPEDVTNLGVEYGGASNWQLPQIGTAQPVQILQRRPTRYKAIISVQSLGPSVPQTAIVSPNSTVTNPGASAIISSISAAQLLAVAPIGTSWLVQWTASLQGTITAADGDNMELVMPLGTVREVGIFPGVVGDYPQQAIVLTPGPGQNISVAAIAAASGVAAVYGAQITATPLAGQSLLGVTGVMLAHRADYLANPANPQGYLIIATPHVIQWENQQPCYAVAIGGGPVTISTIDQAQSASGAPAEESVQIQDYPDESYQQEGGRSYGDDDRNANTY